MLSFRELCDKLNAAPAQGMKGLMYDMPNWTLSIIRDRLGDPEVIEQDKAGSVTKLFFRVLEGNVIVFAPMEGDIMRGGQIMLLKPKPN